jgi:hypothetical protein
MTEVDSRRAAERWFLDNGLPSVVTQRARLRAVWSRSAPALAGYATVGVCVFVAYLMVGANHIEIDGPPTRVEWVVLGVISASLPVAALVGWLVSRIRTDGRRAIASGVAVLVVLASSAVERDVPSLIHTAVVIAVILVLTASGIGSVLAWAARFTASHLATAGSLVIRGLPVVLLTVLVFFNSPVWLMAATVTRGRLWLALLYLSGIAAAFVITGILDRARPILDAASAATEETDALDGTPFEDMPVPPTHQPLTRGERLNVVFVMVASQLVQILAVAVGTALIFFVLGLILMSPELLAAWTRGSRTDGTILGMTIPVPQALIQVTLFLGALTFMYISARAVGDGEYRSQFVDPMIGDLKLTLQARNRYRGLTAK